MKDKMEKKEASRDDEWGDEIESKLPEVWKPEEGDSIVGEYLGVEFAPGEKGLFVSFRVQPEGAELPFAFSGAWLNRKMCQIPIGATVRVTYTGIDTEKKGRPKMYSVKPKKGTKLLTPAESNKVFAEWQAKIGASAGGDDKEIPF